MVRENYSPEDLILVTCSIEELAIFYSVEVFFYLLGGDTFGGRGEEATEAQIGSIPEAWEMLRGENKSKFDRPIILDGLSINDVPIWLKVMYLHLSEL
jgi:hypothetical protein